MAKKKKEADKIYNSKEYDFYSFSRSESKGKFITITHFALTSNGSLFSTKHQCRLNSKLLAVWLA